MTVQKLTLCGFHQIEHERFSQLAVSAPGKSQLLDEPRS